MEHNSRVQQISQRCREINFKLRWHPCQSRFKYILVDYYMTFSYPLLVRSRCISNGNCNKQRPQANIGCDKKMSSATFFLSFCISLNFIPVYRDIKYF